MRLGGLALALVAMSTSTSACGKKASRATPDAAVSVDAGAGAALPTRADCELAVSAMQKVAPALVPGDASDLEECLKLPRALVLCLQGAHTSAEADACVDRSAHLPPGSTGDAGVAPDEPRASLELCTKMVAHYASLVPDAERDESAEAGMLAACTRQLTTRDAECVLGARALAEAEVCLDGG